MDDLIIKITKGMYQQDDCIVHLVCKSKNIKFKNKHICIIYDIFFH